MYLGLNPLQSSDGPQVGDTLPQGTTSDYQLVVPVWGDYPFDLPDLSQIPLSDPGIVPADPGVNVASAAPAAGFPWWLLLVAVGLYAAHKAR
jgi:hypothetical protein